MKEVWVLGASGMLGSAVTKELHFANLSFVPIDREFAKSRNLEFGSSAQSDHFLLNEAVKAFGPPSFIVNAIGVVKPRINESVWNSIKIAVDININFSLNLASFCESNSIHLIQIATDCVYSGIKGSYQESEAHDPADIYGKTKSLGEYLNANISLIRCSIIGRENFNKYSLVEWINSQGYGASINGFINHEWNGITTKVFGKIVSGFIIQKTNPVGRIHLIPRDKVNKFELVSMIKQELGRNDIEVNKFEASTVIDRTLSTEFPELNKQIWEIAGFSSIPTISQMVKLGL